jgi:hypothetical protein
MPSIIFDGVYGTTKSTITEVANGHAISVLAKTVGDYNLETSLGGADGQLCVYSAIELPDCIYDEGIGYRVSNFSNEYGTGLYHISITFNPGVGTYSFFIANSNNTLQSESFTVVWEGTPLPMTKPRNVLASRNETTISLSWDPPALKYGNISLTYTIKKFKNGSYVENITIR